MIRGKSGVVVVGERLWTKVAVDGVFLLSFLFLFTLMMYDCDTSFLVDTFYVGFSGSWTIQDTVLGFGILVTASSLMAEREVLFYHHC